MEVNAIQTKACLVTWEDAPDNFLSTIALLFFYKWAFGLLALVGWGRKIQASDLYYMGGKVELGPELEITCSNTMINYRLS